MSVLTLIREMYLNKAESANLFINILLSTSEGIYHYLFLINKDHILL